MEQLLGIFVYVCAALVVPILLARVVVRAEWRTIRNACFLWYGFLMLVLGGFEGAEGFGWVLIMAMFWSIPAVPVISLVMKSGSSWEGNQTISPRPMPTAQFGHDFPSFACRRHNGRLPHCFWPGLRCSPIGKTSVT